MLCLVGPCNHKLMIHSVFLKPIVIETFHCCHKKKKIVIVVYLFIKVELEVAHSTVTLQDFFCFSFLEGTGPILCSLIFHFALTMS